MGRQPRARPMTRRAPQMATGTTGRPDWIASSRPPCGPGRDGGQRDNGQNGKIVNGIMVKMGTVNGIMVKMG